MKLPPTPPNEQARLEALRCLAILDTPPEREFDDIAELAAELCAAPVALVSLVDRDCQWFKARVGLEVAETPRRVSFCGHAILREDLMVVPDTWEDPRFADNPLVTGDPRIRFYAGAPLITSAGAAVGTLCVLDHHPRDVSARQREALGRLQRQAVKLLELRRAGLGLARLEEEQRQEALLRERFIGVLGHDLRNPLAALRLAGAALRRSADPAVGEVAALIRDDTGRMGRMIDDLLDLTRIRSGGGVPLSPRPGDLAALCRPVLDDCRLTHPKRRVELRAAGDTTGRYDPDRVAQALANLVGNALCYGDPGAPVTISLAGEEDAVSMEIHNDGPPIPAALLPEIFDPFRRGAESGRRNGRGLGLGLFIARAVVEAHGGSIAVRSAAPGGTTFALRWPRTA